ncbi:MAG: polymer-forming cytoskeletal protein [Acidobacteriales bacterium]|nr:polymer-forming cytoskeletal protein [Terriglobales bacterium]
MSFFTKRNEYETDLPKRDDLPQGASPLPNHPHVPSAQADASRTAQVTSRGISNIGRTVTIKGDIRSDEDLQIDGQMEGRLELGQHRLIVASNGQVQASIKAKDVDVHGTVKGNVDASERVTLRKNSRLIGDLKMASVVIEDGAYFKGTVDITQPQSPKINAPQDGQ